jgi:hypothetical protein
VVITERNDIMAQNARRQLVDELRSKLQELEASFRAQRRETPDIAPSGIEPLNDLLPGGGFRNGTIVEWLTGDEGTGACTLAFVSVLPWLRDGQTCVIVDEEQAFHPAFLAALGIDLEQVLMIRPGSKDLWWALEQSLRCRGVAVTVGWLGRAPNRILRRLQLAAETGGGLGVFFRPEVVRAEPAWCQARLLVRAMPSPADSAARRARIEVLYVKGGQGDGMVEVDFHEETGDVRVAAPLAVARNARQAT